MADLSTLTSRQREIYRFIREKIQSRGYGPTVREIGSHFEIKSPNGVMCHLKALQKKGLIHREANMSRAIQLLQDPTSAPVHSGLKIRGRIAAGQPLEAIENAEEFGIEECECVVGTLLARMALFLHSLCEEEECRSRVGGIAAGVRAYQ